MDVFSNICQLLDKQKIDYHVSVHDAVRTSAEAAAIRGVEMKTGAKAMLIRSMGKFYLFILSASEKVDFKKVKRILGVDSTSLATPEEVIAVTHCVPGCVPPFGSLFGIASYVDKGLLEIQELHFSAGKLTHSIRISSHDWKTVENPIVVEFKA